MQQKKVYMVIIDSEISLSDKEKEHKRRKVKEWERRTIIL